MVTKTLMRLRGAHTDLDPLSTYVLKTLFRMVRFSYKHTTVTVYHPDSEIFGRSSFSDFLGSDGIHIFATSLLFGPILLSLSLFQDREWPAKGTRPCDWA